jgi:hypothetical protein
MNIPACAPDLLGARREIPLEVGLPQAHHLPAAGSDDGGQPVKAKLAQAASFQDYLRKQGKPEVIDGSWPLKAWTEAAA